MQNALQRIKAFYEDSYVKSEVPAAALLADNVCWFGVADRDNAFAAAHARKGLAGICASSRCSGRLPDWWS